MDSLENNEQITQDPLALTLDEVIEIVEEIDEQPAWRAVADKEMDYADGNQLDTDLLREMKASGIPPAIEDLIGPTLLAIAGHELKTRTDWRVSPNGEVDGQEVCDAINFKLNQAERFSKADKACSDAFLPQIACGVGWVEVKREPDAFKFPYKTHAVNRNEIHWDMKSVESDLSDARWLRRMRWIHPKRLQDAFPAHADLFDGVTRHGSAWFFNDDFRDGGSSTGLSNSWLNGRGWTRSEEYWHNPTTKEICIAEIWYRRWYKASVLKFPDGRVVEFNEDNPAHLIAVNRGMVKVMQSTMSKVRRSYWMGPVCLSDGPSPYNHNSFPYVPFWGFREDNTGIPYGFVRRMKYNQDALNSAISKLRWGMSVVRIERTKGAVDMTDEQLRKQVSRPNADIVLNRAHMAQQGSRFEIHRDFNLNQQQFQMLTDNRDAIERVSSVTKSFQGQNNSSTSGTQEVAKVEQSTQALTRIMENFNESRTLIGEMLLSLIIEDIGEEQQTIVIEGDAINADQLVVINEPVTSPEGYQYLNNDVQRIRMKVALEDVPSSSSYRAQQMNALSEVVKSLPENVQIAVTPFLTNLMDIPNKRDVVEAIRVASQTPDEKAIQQRIDDAVKQALSEANIEARNRELDLREREVEANIELTKAKQVQTGVQSSFSAMQGAVQVAQMPQIAPIADVIMQGAGYERPDPMGDDPNFVAPEQAAAMNMRSPYIQGEGSQVGSEQIPEMAQLEQSAPKVQENTHPSYPPVPQEGASGLEGINTPRTSDNL